MKKNKTHLISNGILIIVLLAVAFSMMVPFLWMITSSFKNNNEIFLYPIRWIPEPIRLKNYVEVWTKIPFFKYFRNTFLYSITVTVGQIITCSMAAYAFAKLRFPGKNFIFMIYLATMMVPWHAVMIPQFMINKRLGFYNTPWSIIIMNLVSVFGIFLMRQAMAESTDAGSLGFFPRWSFHCVHLLWQPW